MECYRLIQYGSCLAGIVLLLYGVCTLPQPQTTEIKVDSQKTAEQVQQAYTNLVVNSTPFTIMMTGLGVFVAGILWIGMCRRDTAVLPAPVARPTEAMQPTEVMQP